MAKKHPTTQKYLEIAEVRNDVVVMKDGSLRAVLLVSSVNFSLKSEEEQNSLIAAYASFLNTLDFPLQIVIQSRRLNIDEYLLRLKNAEEEQTNDLLRVQIADYRDFVGELVKLGDIMTKKFYIVVPYNPLGDLKKGFFARLKELFSPVMLIHFEEKKFFNRRAELMQRVSHITQGLLSMGLKAAQLNTYNLIQLYYETYNPQEALAQRLEEIDKLKLE
jgi:type IV secretory pathway VirB4 component